MEQFAQELNKFQFYPTPNNCYLTSSNLFQPNQCITMYFGDGRQISLGENVTYTGFVDPTEACLAFLDKLVEVFPYWQRGMY